MHTCYFECFVIARIDHVVLFISRKTIQKLCLRIVLIVHRGSVNLLSVVCTISNMRNSDTGSVICLAHTGRQIYINLYTKSSI